MMHLMPFRPPSSYTSDTMSLFSGASIWTNESPASVTHVQREPGFGRHLNQTVWGNLKRATWSLLYQMMTKS